MVFVDKILLFLFCLHFKVVLNTCLPPNEDMQEVIGKLKEDGKSMKGMVDTMGSLEDLVFKLIGQVGEIKGIVETMKGEFDKMEWKIEGNFKEVQSKIANLENSESKMEVKMEDISRDVINGTEELEKRVKGNFKEMQSKIANLEKSESKMEVKLEDISRDVINGTKEKRVKESEFLNTTNVINNEIKQLESRGVIVNNEIKQLESRGVIINNEIKQLKSRGLIDRLFPVNSIHVTFANISPPMQGQFGVSWEQLPEGFVLMTGNGEDVGQRTGSQRLDGGNTNGHALSVDEMPSHTHSYSHAYHDATHKCGSDCYAAYNQYSSTTTSTGGDSPHQHTLDILNQKVLVWRRTS